MRFAEPGFIYYYILIIAALGAFYFWAFRSRKKAYNKYAQRELLKELTLSTNYSNQRLKAACMFLGVVLALAAMLRPQWGFVWQESKRKGLDILIAIDTSKSMLATDVLPNRLERSKLAIRDFVRNLKGDRIGLIAFSGSAFLECPLTLDYGGFLLSLDSLNFDTIPRGGTALASAIKEGLKSYEGGQKKHKILIMITDGEDHEGDPVKISEQAKKQGVEVYCIGIGTSDGELVPVTDGSGRKEFLKDQSGNAVKSRLDEGILQKIALATGGSYLRSTPTEFGLELLYQERFSKMEKSEFQGKMNKRYQERFGIFLVLALMFFLIEIFLSERNKV